jgi:carbon storage regulator
MLVLTRKKNETIVINDNVEITIVDIQNDQIRIGVNAPKSVKIYRKEIYDSIKEENKKAAATQIDSLDELKKNFKI